MRNSADTKAPMLSRSQILLSIFCAASAAIAISACGGPSTKKGTPRPYAAPTVDGVLAELAAKEAKAQSFIAESRMEYWVDGERVKPTVLIMGERGAKVRFNALNPAGDDVASDLACNGANFQYVDFTNDCQLVGLCNKNAISRLLRVSLEPDDFLLLAIGSTPIISNPTGDILWDSSTKRETLNLKSGDGSSTQTIVLDGRNRSFDVISSTVRNAQGEIEWQITNKNYSVHKSEDDVSFRLPEKTRFKQPMAKAELSIRWVDRSINAELSSDKFVMEIPPELPTCGQKAP